MPDVVRYRKRIHLLKLNVNILLCIELPDPVLHDLRRDRKPDLSDHSKGFGGKFGVQTDRVDKSAVGWDDKEKLQQHESQKGEKMILCLNMRYPIGI